MPNFVFTRNIPLGSHNPSVDQNPMKNNFNSTDSIIDIDHFGFNDNLGGYHDIIHQPAQVADPAPIGGPPQINQVYVKSYTPDTTGGVADVQLFNRTSVGQISQLTGYNTSSTSDGWQWIGGILVQWGVVAFAGGNSHETGTVTFKDRVAGAIPFPTNTFVVIPGLRVASSGTTTSSNTIAIRSKSLTQFSWVFNSSSSSGSTAFPGFYWYAVGN